MGMNSYIALLGTACAVLVGVATGSTCELSDCACQCNCEPNESGGPTNKVLCSPIVTAPEFTVYDDPACAPPDTGIKSCAEAIAELGTVATTISNPVYTLKCGQDSFIYEVCDSDCILCTEGDGSLVDKTYLQGLSDNTCAGSFLQSYGDTLECRVVASDTVPVLLSNECDKCPSSSGSTQASALSNARRFVINQDSAGFLCDSEPTCTATVSQSSPCSATMGAMLTAVCATTDTCAVTTSPVGGDEPYINQCSDKFQEGDASEAGILDCEVECADDTVGYCGCFDATNNCMKISDCAC